MTQKKARTNDIGTVLNRVNDGDLGYFTELQNNEERRKELSPFVLFYYVKGAQQNHAIHTTITNEMVNPYLFELGAHPLLLYKLIVAANSGIDKTRYQFQRPNQKPATKAEKAVVRHFDCSLREARDTINVIDADELKQIKEIYEV